MSDNRKIAAAVMDTARRAVMQERRDQHGDAENSFQMIADLWEVYLTHKWKLSPGAPINGYDVSQMMSLLKKARAMYGNATIADHYADDIGYTGLAAMLGGAK